MNNTDQTTESRPTIETKPIYFPLCTDFSDAKGDIHKRLWRYTESHCASSKNDLLFSRDLNHKLTDDEGDEHYTLDAAWRRAVLEWHRRPKIHPSWTGDRDEDLTQLDWLAYEKMAAAVANAGAGRGRVFIAFGQGRTGKTVGARWISDIKTVLRADNDIVPAFLTAAEFADFGTYRSRAVKLVETLQGVRRAYGKEHEKKYNETYEIVSFRPCSVIDGLAADKLSATETGALLAAIEASTDRGEFDLIMTTPQNTAEGFIAQLAAGPNAIQIVNRVNEQAVFIEFKSERVGRCPWFDDSYNLLPPYALPDDDD